MVFLDTLRLVLSPPHRAGHPFIAGAAAIAVAGLAIGHGVFTLGVLLTLFCLYFFRDPDRVPPPHQGVVLAAADGKIVSIAKAVPPPELGLGDTPLWRVATFLSILNVHVNRAPTAGIVSRIAYRPGAYLNASLDKASEDNERNAIAIRLPNGQSLAVIQIAGLVARRILCDLREGDAIIAGQRLGIIRFGSRTDIYLPAGVEPLVAVGQTMIAGETVIAVV
jgi:phosphatidylserine decarboxylase